MSQNWQESVIQTLSGYVDPEDKLLVAVSGGADSMAMLAWLVDQRPSERIVAGHIRHGLRDDDFEDEQLVRRFADRAGIECRSAVVKTRDYASNHRVSIEAAARDLRYRALLTMAEGAHCKWILTGHTLDDSSETVLMRMRSGAPWWEWTGIPQRRERIIRPFLRIPREQIRSWATERGIPFREDPSNRDLRFRRNRLRSELSSRPEFWTENHARLTALAGGQWGDLYGVLRRLSKQFVLNKIQGQPKGEIGLAIHEILGYFNSLAFLPVEVAWALLLNREMARLPSKYRRQILDVFGGTSPKADVALPHEIVLKRRGRMLWLGRDCAHSLAEIPLTEGRHELPGAGELVASRQPLKIAGRGTAYKVNLRGHSVVLRRWKADDKLRPVGRKRRKVSDWLSEQRLSPFARDRQWIAADEIGPLIILGGMVDERVYSLEDDEHTLWIGWYPLASD